MAKVSINSDVLHAMFVDPDGPIGELLEKTLLKIETVAKVLLTVPGSGRLYTPGSYFLTRGDKVYHWVRFTTHRASAPGEPPSSDTGQLLTAVTHRLGVDGDHLYGEVVANKNYSIYVELGTRFMAPRPFLRPALSAGMQ